MKKAIVFYLWGIKNAGDMAICLGTISLLKELKYEITFLSRFTEKEKDYIDSKKYINIYHSDVNIEPGIFVLNREDSKLKILISYLKGIAKIISPVDDTRVKKLISESDVVFLNGGNILRGNSLNDYARLMALFYPFHIAQNLGKCMLCLPQSTAKSSKVGVKILQRKLRNFDTVFIREGISYLALKENLNGVSLKKSTDLALFLKDSSTALNRFNKKYGTIIDKEKKSIALIFRATTIGDVDEFDSTKKGIIISHIVRFVEEFKSDYNIYFVIQTEKDKNLTRHIKRVLDNMTNITLIEEYDPYVIREIYKNMDFIVAMRLHAAILAISSGTPVIGYFDEEWGYKNPGIMDDIGMPWTMDGSELINYGYKLISRYNEYVNNITKFINLEKSNIIKEFNKNTSDLN